MKTLELKNCNPKDSEEWAIVARFDSVEFTDEPERYVPTEVEIDGEE